MGRMGGEGTYERLVSSPVGIDGAEDGECDGGGERQSLTGRWLENSQKVAISPPSATTSLVAIAAVAVVVGSFKMEISLVPKKWPEPVATTTEIDWKNTVAGGHYDGMVAMVGMNGYPTARWSRLYQSSGRRRAKVLPAVSQGGLVSKGE